MVTRRRVRRRRSSARPGPLAARCHLDAEGLNFAVRAPSATRSRRACSTIGGEEARVPLRSAATGPARLRPRRRGRDSATASARTGRGTPGQGLRFNPAKLLARPLRPRHRRRASRWRRRARGRRPPATPRTTGPARLRAARAARRSSSTDDFDWGGDRPPDVPWARHGRLRAARQGLHRAAPRRARGAARHVRRARAPGGDRAPASARRDGGRAAAGAPVRHRAAAGRGAGLANYWGYNTLGFFAPHAGYAADAAPRRAGRASSSGWCRRCTRPASR